MTTPESNAASEPPVRSILDLGMKLSIPYNHDFELVRKIEPWAKYIRSMYLPCHQRVSPSGRFSPPGHPGWALYDQEVNEIIGTLGAMGIETIMLFNGVLISGEVLKGFPGSDLYHYLQDRIADGLQWVAVANIHLAQLIREHFPQLKIDVSLLAYVDSVTRARYWKQLVDPDMITVDLDRSRDFELLRALRDTFSIPLKVLASSSCLPACPYNVAHYVHFCVGENPTFNCVQAASERPWRYYRGRIVPPYYLRRYKDLVTDIKITDRSSQTWKILRKIEFYATAMDSRSHYPDNGLSEPSTTPRKVSYALEKFYYSYNSKNPLLRPLPKGVFDKTASCDQLCDRCDFCLDTWTKDWQVNEDLSAILAFIHRHSPTPERARCYERSVRFFYAQRHNVPFVRQLQDALEHYPERLHEVLCYYLAVCFLEAKEPDLAAPYAQRLKDPGLSSSLDSIREKLRDRPVLRYLEVDEEDADTLLYLSRLRASTRTRHRASLAATYLRLREPAPALAIITALEREALLTEEMRDRLIHQAFSSWQYPVILHLTRDLAAAQLRTHEVVMVAYALHKTGASWEHLRERITALVNRPGPLDAKLLYSLMRLGEAGGVAPLPEAQRGALVEYANHLRGWRLFTRAREVFDLLLQGDPADITVLKLLASTLRDMGLLHEAEQVEQTSAAVRQRNASGRRALEMQEDSPEKHGRLAQLLLEQRECDAARLQALRLLDRDPKSREAWQLLVHSLQGLGKQAMLREYQDRYYPHGESLGT